VYQYGSSTTPIAIFTALDANNKKKHGQQQSSAEIQQNLHGLIFPQDLQTIVSIKKLFFTETDVDLKLIY
jgi:hypothetical protein